MISYAILTYGEITREQIDNDTTTAPPPVFRDLSICGKNDCQDPNLTNENSDRYEPASITLIYILVGVMGGLVLLAMIIHQVLVKPIDPSFEIQDKIQKMNKSKAEEVGLKCFQLDSRKYFNKFLMAFVHRRQDRIKGF